MSWNGGDTDFRWPWLMLLLALVVIGLLIWWARRPTPGVERTDAAYVAHAERLRALPRYQALLRRRVRLGAWLSLAALVTCAGTVLLAGRVQDRQVTENTERSRDIMLCLDSSGSMAEIDAAVLREFRKIVERLEGERIGLTIWSGVAITVFPLTDDYEFALDQLVEAERAFGSGGVYSEEYAVFTAGTVLHWDVQSQFGDGLASCVQRFDRRDEERSRAIVLASDNEPIGEGVFDAQSAADLAARRDVVVHGIAAPTTFDRPDALRQFERATETTGGTFALLGEDGSTAAVVEAIGDLEAVEIEQPPVVRVSDRPDLGIAVTLVGVSGMVAVWIVGGVLAARGRREEAGR